MEGIDKELVKLGFDIGSEVRKKVHRLPHRERGSLRPSVLKGKNTRLVDVVGEEIALARVEGFAKSRGIQFKMIVDESIGETYDVGPSTKEAIYFFSDPIDGTVKIAGLGNSKGTVRVVNDGNWSVAHAFTSPTEKQFGDLKVKDFEVSVVVDGNPNMFPHGPTNAFSYRGINGKFETYERSETDRPEINSRRGLDVRLYTSTQEEVSQGALCYEAFCVFDRKTASEDGENLSVEIFRQLSNRNEGGVFDLWHSYGTYSEIITNLFGYGPQLIEPQAIGRISMNDAYSNFVAAYGLMNGAGGSIYDIQTGRDVGERKISERRPHTLASANEVVREKILEKCSKALSAIKE